MRLTGDHVYLRYFEDEDAEDLLELQIRNADFFQLYTPLREADHCTLAKQLGRIRNAKEKIAQDQTYLFGIFEKETDALIGDLGLFFVSRGPEQSAMIGYALDQAYNGKGMMTEAVRLAVEYGIRALGLHRIHAGVMPHNLGSIRVLEKAGFQREGIARKNVMINGKWEDHVILAILDEDMA